MIGRPTQKEIERLDGKGLIARHRRTAVGELHDLQDSKIKRDNMIYRFTIIGPNKCLISVSRGKTTALSIKPPPLPRKSFTEQELRDKYPHLYKLAIFKGLDFS